LRAEPIAQRETGAQAQLSLTIAITIDASRQATMITMLAIQRRGMERS
jgi:hypothetical protein